jgi:hypothetical protein
MGFGIGKRQCGTPGRAEQHPFVHIETQPKLLDILNQVPGGVRRGVGFRIGCIRQAAAAIALIEENDAVGEGSK